MPTSRTRVAERVHLEDALPLTCQCGKRLGVIGGNGFGQAQLLPLVEVRRGQPVLADDWRAVSCPRCQRTWEGRLPTLVARYRDALAIKATRVTLPD